MKSCVIESILGIVYGAAGPGVPESGLSLARSNHYRRPRSHYYGYCFALQALPGCQMLWQHRVIGLTQDSDGVNVEVLTPRGVKYLRAPYVLAADGSQSTVRNLLGISIPVTANDYRILTLDVQMQGAEPPSERYFWFDPPFNPGHIAQLNPLPGKIYRLDYQLSSREDPLAINQSAALHERIVATIGQQPYQL